MVVIKWTFIEYLLCAKHYAKLLCTSSHLTLSLQERFCHRHLHLMDEEIKAELRLTPRAISHQSPYSYPSTILVSPDSLSYW